MRRRIWCIMVQIDGLTSYQLGLPSMVNEALCDSQTPRNLHDEDFGPDSALLPPSRPTTDLTPVLYVVTKAELSAVFRNVYARVVLGRTDSYEEVMALDRRLEGAREAISPRFRGFDLQDAVTVAPYVMVRRYTLETLYLKTVCMLHRHHMTLSLKQPAYRFSRHRCLAAAMTILKHHADILRQMQSGGALYRNTIFASSIEQADFLLASIIVCLELSSRAQSSAHPGTADCQTEFSQQDLIEALQQSHKYLAESKDSSSESQQALNVLTVMLRKFSETSGAAQGAREAPSINLISPSFGDSEACELAQEPLKGERPLTCLLLPVNAIPHHHPSNDIINQLGTDFGSEVNSTPSNFQDISSFFASPDAVDWVWLLSYLVTKATA